MSPRPQIDHIRKPQLLAAAAEVIAERGFAATRIADVAERAGTSAPGVLYWFDSRDALLAEALSFAERAFHDELAAALEPLEDPRARLATLIERSVGGDDWVLWIELWTRALRDPQVSESRQLLDDDWRAQIAAIIARRPGVGRLRPARARARGARARLADRRARGPGGARRPARLPGGDARAPASRSPSGCWASSCRPGSRA